MALKFLCDWCGEEMAEKDVRIAKVEKYDGTPAASPQEICVHCKERLLTAISSIIKEVVNG